MEETKNKLYLVHIGIGYVEHASISSLMFFLVLEEDLDAKQVADKFVKNVTDLYRSDFKTPVGSDICCEKDVGDANFCPQCGRKVKYNQLSVDQISDLFKREFLGTVDGSSPFWWDGGMEQNGWIYFTSGNCSWLCDVSKVIDISGIDYAIIGEEMDRVDYSEVNLKEK